MDMIYKKNFSNSKINTVKLFLIYFDHKIEKPRQSITLNSIGDIERMVKLNKTDKMILEILKSEAKEMTLQEIADKLGEPTKKTFKSIRKLFQNEFVDTKARKYKLIDK